MEIKEIYDLSETDSCKEVSVSGWIRKHRKQKDIGFIEISDGTCFKTLQIVYDEEIQDFDEIKKIHFGSCIKVSGKLVKKDNQEIELKASKFVDLSIWTKT